MVVKSSPFKALAMHQMMTGPCYRACRAQGFRRRATGRFAPGSVGVDE